MSRSELSSHNEVPRKRPLTWEEAREMLKSFELIPTQLEMPIPPPDNLPPEEQKKADEEYERAMKQYVLESTYGANYKENPLWLYREPYLDAEWEAIKWLWL